MKHVMDLVGNHIVLIAVLLVVGFIFIASAVILEAWMDTRKRPREEMFWCNKHGFVRKKHCLELFPGMKKQNGGPFLGCPFCLQSVMVDVEKK